MDKKNVNVYEEVEIEETIDETIEDMMCCDYTGFCCGVSCRNWINCHN